MNDDLLKKIESNKENLSISTQLLEKTNEKSQNDNIIISKKVYSEKYKGNVRIIPFYKDIVKLF